MLISMKYSDRICSAGETLERVLPLLGTHGVTRLARITGLDRIGIPVWNAIRPNARSIAIHQGKGIQDVDAKVSATMEALERAVAEDPQVSIREATIEALQAEGVRYEDLAALIGARQDRIAHDDQVEWATGVDLSTQERVMIPKDALVLDRTRPNRYWLSSDGLASGNTEEEAIFHGLLERIERDAETLWLLKSAAKRAASAVDPSSFSDPVLNSLIDKVEVASFRLQLFDMTSDLNVPVFAALLAPMEHSALRYIDVTNGSGAHPVAVRAAIRAVTEAVQSRLTLISGARDDVPPESYNKPAGDHIQAELVASAVPWAGRSLAHPHETIASMLKAIMHQIETRRAGPIIAVRLNPDENRMAVVKVLATKLENPEGQRRQAHGGRALSKMLTFQ